MLVIGIDIGTTTISFNAVERDSGIIINSVTIPNNSSIINISGSSEDLQDPLWILNCVSETLSQLIDDINDIACIGIAGQMHGIVYINDNGDAVSPLYTWRDGSGNEKIAGDEETTYADYLSEVSGYKISSGEGILTYYYHLANQKVPDSAISFCSINDYIAMKLAARKEALIHSSNAASFGIFDIYKNHFDVNKIEKAGLNKISLPKVSDGYDILGYYLGKIPVCIAIGDNQSSFISSVRDFQNSILVNIGTGSQITFAAGAKEFIPGLELRPCVKDKYIQVGSSLCGGRALSLLENFFRRAAEIVTCNPIKSGYYGIDRYLESIYQHRADFDNNSERLQISTKFSGTRKDPTERGNILNINMTNFTPEQMIFGFMHGVIDELYELYRYQEKKHTCLVGSGNALRKNRYLQYIASQAFGMDMKIPVHSEETAYGAALFAMVCSGYCASIEKAQEKIRYEDM